MNDHFNLYWSAGIAAGVIAAIDPLPYIRDTIRGSTRPHRGTWLIWTLHTMIAFWSQLADGGTWSLGMVAVQAVSTAFIFCLSIRRGEGGMTRRDQAMLALAGFGLLGWAVTSTPMVATVCVIVADAIGAVMMLPKTWRDPWSETWSTYALASLSGLLSSVAATGGGVELLAFPVYFTVITGLTVAVILWRRRVLAGSPIAVVVA